MCVFSLLTSKEHLTDPPNTTLILPSLCPLLTPHLLSSAGFLSSSFSPLFPLSEKCWQHLVFKLFVFLSSASLPLSCLRRNKQFSGT